MYLAQNVEVEILPDTGAQINLVSHELLEDLGIPSETLEKPIRVGSVNDPQAMIIRKRVKLRHQIGGRNFEDDFFVAPLQGKPDLILGTPWMKNHCPEILDALRQIGTNPQRTKISTLRGGGETKKEWDLIKELDWQDKIQARRVQILYLRAAVSEALEEKQEDRRVMRAAIQGDPGIRGLTGNKEGWRETIPPEFRDFTETVFSDSVLHKSAPPRPGFECKITLKDGETLTKRNPYELPYHQLQNLKALLDNEEAAGVIRRSEAPHAMPGFFVTDPGSKQERWVVDFREINEKCKKDAYPLPRVNTIIERAARAKFVSTLDISKAFAMIPMQESSKELTAFTTPHGMFEYNVMPMGLANAPSIWQRFIDSILGPYSHDFCFAYLDDILIVSETKEDHVKHCRKILEVLQKHGLHAKPHKCHWFQKEVEFLGFRIIAGKGVTMAADKLQGIRDMEAPKRVKDLRTLLGVFGYNERFAPHYSDCTACLTDLLKKDVPWEWTEERQKAFEELKRRFMEEILLVGWQPGKPIRMFADASDVSHAVWLEQQQEDGAWKPFLLSSHKFKDGEKGWDGPDKELFAIVDAFDRYRKWLAQPGCTVQVFSDHRNLAKFMFTSSLLKSHDGRLGRWAQELSQCDFEIQYLPGTENVGADWLSRYNLPDSVELDGRQLLPAYRFSKKALTDIAHWFRSQKDSLGLRKRLEQSFAGREKENAPLTSIFSSLGWPEAEKLNDSPDPVPAPKAAMAAPRRFQFWHWYRRRHPEARLPEVPRENVRGKDDVRGLGYQA